MVRTLVLLSIILTAAFLMALARLRRRPAMPTPAVCAQPTRPAPGAPVAAGAPGAAKRRPLNQGAGHFTAYTRTSGKNAPASRRALSRPSTSRPSDG